MNAEIVELRPSTLMGITARIDPKQADYGALWEKRFGPRETEVARLAVAGGYCGAYFGTERPGEVDFIAGMIVPDSAVPPEGLVARVIPGGPYARFRCAMAEIAATWGAIYRDWLPASSQVEDEARPCFEEYPAGEVGPGTPVSIYVPLRARGILVLEFPSR